MTLLSRLFPRQADTEAAERFHRALMNPDALCSDPETAGLLETTHLLAPAVAMSPAGRRATIARLNAALQAADAGEGSDDAGSLDCTGDGHGSNVRFAIDAGDLGMLAMSDMEPITEERAQKAAEALARVLAERAARP